jgi:hypothetical protein
MYASLIDADALMTLLEQLVLDCESQSQAARRLGVSQGFLSDVLLRRRAPGKTIAAYFGYRPVTLYRATMPPP